MKPYFDPSLYLVTDSDISLARPLEWIVEEAVSGGVSMVQLREKKLSSREFLVQARKLKSLLDRRKIPLIINDRMDIALAVDASGLHIGQGDFPVDVVRFHLGSDALIGLSVGSVEEAREAETMDVDYLGISPVFSTKTKHDLTTPVGLNGVQEISRCTRHPTIGIGGIHSFNAREVICSGANGIAVVSAIVSSEHPRQSAMELLQQVNNGQRVNKVDVTKALQTKLRRNTEEGNRI